MLFHVNYFFNAACEDVTPFQWASELDHSLAKNHKSSISRKHGKQRQTPSDEDKKR